MAEWPVVLVKELENVARGEVEPGDDVLATWANISGDPHAAIWIICPRCGTLGHCPRQGSGDAVLARRGWTVDDANGKLTVRPSILCQSAVGLNADGKIKRLDTPCGGHYFLTDGVLREVQPWTPPP